MLYLAPESVYLQRVLIDAVLKKSLTEFSTTGSYMLFRDFLTVILSVCDRMELSC